jgi:hypothetical protein
MLRKPFSAPESSRSTAAPLLQIFVDRVPVGEIEIDVYAVAIPGAPPTAHYLLYLHGTCVNANDPFWRLPGAAQIAAFLATQRPPKRWRRAARQHSIRLRQPCRARTSVGRSRGCAAR